jgi:phosphoglycerol transferase MdoB-like AlkP superfamily enzyme
LQFARTAWFPPRVIVPLLGLAQADPVNFVIAVVIAAGLAMLIFRHADKHGSHHATAWGLFTFLAALVAIPLYFLNYWLAKSRRSS